MKKALTVLSTIALISSFGAASFATCPCQCHKHNKPCPVVKPAAKTTAVKPVVVQPAVVKPVTSPATVQPLASPVAQPVVQPTGQKTGGAAPAVVSSEQVRPMNMTAAQKLEYQKLQLRKKAVEDAAAKKDTTTDTAKK